MSNRESLSNCLLPLLLIPPLPLLPTTTCRQNCYLYMLKHDWDALTSDKTDRFSVTGLFTRNGRVYIVQIIVIPGQLWYA
jgi:hypothetical protein